MGVMECRRKGCTNIMCEMYSQEFGYICWSCFEELVDKQIDVGTFMETPKQNNSPYTRDYYEKVFGKDKRLE